MEAIKKGFIFCAKDENKWWKTHLMAPAPILLNADEIRIYGGCWDSLGISRIGYIDVKIADPTCVIRKSSIPLLDIGIDGCFDDNGVFPAHVYNFGDGRVWLYYTGFQLLHKIAFSNFSGLAVSNDNGNTFQRYSKAPVMDRADEGLYTRAGISIFPDTINGGYHCVYSAGCDWFYLEGKKRPVYEVFYQKTPDGIHFCEKGEKIVSCDLNIEHGLGRPQIIKLGEYYYVFYTRRIIDGMRYFLGCARTNDFKHWERCDDVFENVTLGKTGEFDERMVYFPGVVKVNDHMAYCFYTGNHYGEDGIGYIQLDF